MLNKDKTKNAMEHQESAPKQRSYEVKKDTTPPIEDVVGDLLTNAEIKELPEEEQGKVIVDRFVGALVRHGGVESSNADVGVLEPHEILAKIDKIGTKDEDGLHTVRELTRNDGLRGGIEKLAEDPRTAALFGSMSQQLAIGHDGRGGVYYALTTPAQIDGYIEAGGDKNKDSRARPYTDPTEWVGVISSDIDRVMRGGEWRSDKDIARDTSNRDLVTPDWYERSNSLREARGVAKYSGTGIDLDLLRESAEYIRDRDEATKRELGSRAVSLVTGRARDRYERRQKQSFDNRVNGYLRR